MLPIAVLPAAGILLRLGQPDLLGGIKAPIIGPFFESMSAAGDAIFANLALLFAVGVARSVSRASPKVRPPWQRWPVMWRWRASSRSCRPSCWPGRPTPRATR